MADRQLTVVGAGGGGMATASEAALQGWEVTIADLPEFGAQIDAIAAAGGISARFRANPADESAPEVFAPVRTIKDPAAAVSGAPLIIACVPAYGHEPIAELLAPHLSHGQMIIWAGEGGGAFATVAALRKLGRDISVLAGETNSLPYAGAFITGPGTLGTTRKTGGTWLAAIPTEATAALHAAIVDIWPWVGTAENAWETLLLNFNAIDHVATMICNLGTIERDGPFRLWGEGATPGVANIIEDVDGEYLALRSALGLADATRYEQFLVAQGLVDAAGDTLYDTIANSLLSKTVFNGGRNALDHRFVAEDVPFALVLASSLGDAVGVDTPVIDSLITLCSAAARRDFRAAGRTLDDWGMGSLGAEGLRKAVDTGRW